MVRPVVEQLRGRRCCRSPQGFRLNRGFPNKKTDFHCGALRARCIIGRQIKESAVLSRYVLAGTLLGIAGVVGAVFVDPNQSVTYVPVEGITVFAVLYVISQGAERLTEWLVELLSLLPSSPGKKKEETLRRLSNSTVNGNPVALDFDAVVEAKETVDKARTDISFVAHGFSILVCALAVIWLNYGLMKHIGAQGVGVRIDHLLTALAAAGGAKGLHELIGRMQKAKEKAEVAPAT